MKNAIRLGVVIALMTGASGARADDDPYTEGAPAPQTQQVQQKASAGTSTGDPVTVKTEASAGAGSMEPYQAIDEQPGESSHQKWVESIWTSP
jgi:hypothetical protein